MFRPTFMACLLTRCSEMQFAAISATVSARVPTKHHRTSLLKWSSAVSPKKHILSPAPRVLQWAAKMAKKRVVEKEFPLHPDANLKSLNTLVNPASMTAHHEQNTLLGVGGEVAQRVYVLGCRDHLHMLMQADFVIGDGTFASAPNISFQNCSIVIQVSGSNVVVLDCLLMCTTRCSTSSYNLFHSPRVYLKPFLLLFPHLRGQIASTTWIVDNESAVVGFLQSRHAVVSSFYFHFGQAVFRRLNEIGLRQKFHEMTSLAFLPPTDILEACPALKLHFQHDELPWARYFETTWVGARAGGESWCCGSSDSCPVPTISLVSPG